LQYAVAVYGRAAIHCHAWFAVLQTMQVATIYDYRKALLQITVLYLSIFF